MTTVERILRIRADEKSAVLWASAYAFSIFLSYYILRPVRDEISAADRGNVHLIWTAVFFAMLVVVPLYSAIVARYSRGVFIPLINRFFILNLVLFYVSLHLLPLSSRVWLDRIFYIWASVFALFVVTVFWGFMADLFTRDQGKRLYGAIAFGGTLGAIIGSSVTALLVDVVPAFTLLLIACIPLEIAAWCATALNRRSGSPQSVVRSEDEPVSGGVWTGIQVVFRSPYLRRIALYVVLMTFASTILYFQQADLIGNAFEDRGDRTALYAKMDLAVNVITLSTQGLLTAHIIRRVGVGISLAVVPLVAMIGFATLGLYPALVILVVTQVLYRSLRYALAKPTREVLFTVVGREEKYKSKAFIDAAVYRGGDLVSGWVYAGLAAIGLSLGGIALVAAPVALLWALTGLRLGRLQDRLAEAQSTDPAIGQVVEPVVFTS
jgi:AAA family ATP:ADP antiporter